MANSMTNEIPERQNEEAQIRLLRARRQVYSRGKALLSLQMSLTLGVPIIGSIASLCWPNIKGLVAMAAIIIAIADICLFDRLQKSIMKVAAKLQEQFDCFVLQMPWNAFTAGARVDPEAIHGDAKKHMGGQSDEKLFDWYPPSVGKAPIHLARIICQRTNLWYDSKLRRTYGNIALGTGLLLCIFLLSIAWYREFTIDAFVLSFFAPASPIIIWCVREFLRQGDAADVLDRLRSEAESFWNEAKGGQLSAERCAVRSREFQNAIFDRRASSPLTFDWIYKLRRSALEEQMNMGAEEFLREIDPVALKQCVT